MKYLLVFFALCFLFVLSIFVFVCLADFCFFSFMFGCLMFVFYCLLLLKLRPPKYLSQLSLAFIIIINIIILINHSLKMERCLKKIQVYIFLNHKTTRQHVLHPLEIKQCFQQKSNVTTLHNTKRCFGSGDLVSKTTGRLKKTRRMSHIPKNAIVFSYYLFCWFGTLYLLLYGLEVIIKVPSRRFAA